MLRINEPGFYTNNKFAEDDLILEARWMLAARYNQIERSNEAHNCFWGRNALNAADTLKRWDSYNARRTDPFYLIGD